MRIKKNSNYLCGLLSSGRGIGYGVSKLVAAMALILFPLTINAQSIGIGEFLSAAKSSQELQLHQRKLDYLQNNDHSMPWADQLEFRTETDEMDFGRQEYLSRFRFNSKSERKAHEKIHGANIRSEEIESSLILSDLLLDRYYLILDYFVLNKKIAIKKEEHEIALDKIKVLRKKGINSSDDFNLRELLRAEDDEHTLEQEILELKGEIEFNKIVIFGTPDIDEKEIDANDFISIEEVIQKLEQLQILSTDNPAVLRRQINIEKNGFEYDLDKKGNDWKIDYMQFKYAGREKLGFGREWSFGLGMEIPIKEANRLDNNEYQLEKIDLENRLALEKTSIQEQVLKTSLELNSKIEQLGLIERQLQESQLLYSSENYAQHKDVDPIVLLNIKSYLLKREMDKQGVEEDIYSLYLELIELTGKVTEIPLRNYFSNNWDLLEN